MSPCGKMMCIVGDNENCLIIEAETGKIIGLLEGHIDYGFSSAWNPRDPYIVATGNQDKTVRIWDVRALSSTTSFRKRSDGGTSIEMNYKNEIENENVNNNNNNSSSSSTAASVGTTKKYIQRSLYCIEGRLGSINSAKFSADGKYLACSEAGDFVHIFDHDRGYSSEQEIDIFGEICGINFSPGESPTVGETYDCNPHFQDVLFVGVSDRTYKSILEFQRKKNDFTDSILI